MPRTTAMPDPRMSIKDVSEEFGISEKTARRYIAQGRLAAERMGPRLIRVRRSDAEALFRPIPATDGVGA
jgi:DNA binding domain, excisionase family